MGDYQMDRLSVYLEQLDGIHGVSGDEEMVAHYMIENLQPLTDEYYQDSLGNLIFIKRGTDPNYKLMLSAHMDEIGYIVRYIDANGFVYLLPVGIHDPRMVINQFLNINTSKGMVAGVTGSKPSHIVSPEEASKTIPIDQVYVDVGTSSRDETEELGVNVGDYVSFAGNGQFLNGGKIYAGKSIDNRAGCAVMLEVMREIQKLEVVPTVYAVATIQEEIGIRGAGPAAYGIEPDIALAIDVVFAGGTPGTPEQAMPIKMGGGPAIKFFDWSLKTFNGNAVPKKLTNHLMSVAKKHQIPFQRDVMVGGATDGAKISLAGKGVLTGGVSIPMRYMHTAVGCVQIDDMRQSVSLIKEFIVNTK
jgi:putative aminopeptidase FrvX